MYKNRVIPVAKQLQFATKIIKTFNKDNPNLAVDIQYSQKTQKGMANLYAHTNEQLLVTFRFCLKHKVKKINIVVK